MTLLKLWKRGDVGAPAPVACVRCGNPIRLSDSINRDGDRGFAHKMCIEELVTAGR